MAFQVNIFFAGLMVFARDDHGSIARVVLFDARSRRRPGIAHHYPRLWWRSGACGPGGWSGPWELDREQLELSWLGGAAMTHGASPYGGPLSGPLPDPRTARWFAWSPDLEKLSGLTCKIDPRYGQAAAVLDLPAGVISTCRFATIRHRQGRRTIAVVPALRYSVGSQFIPHKQAVAELCRLEVTVPSRAGGLRASSTALPGGTAHGSLELRDPGSDGCIDLFLANQPRPTPSAGPNGHPGRQPGYRARHFAKLYALLKSTLPGGARRLPQVPAAIALTGTSPNAVEAASLGLTCPFRSPDSRGMKPRSLNNRPICPIGSGSG